MKMAYKYVLRILGLYLIWTLLGGMSVLKTIITAPDPKIQLIYFIRDTVFGGSFYWLWFLPATAFAVFLTSYLLSRKINIRSIIIISALFYAIGLLEQSYFGFIRSLKNIPAVWNVLKLLGSIMVTTRNGLFEGFLFVSLGMLLAYKPIKIKCRTALICFALSVIFFLAETIIIKNLRFNKGLDMYIMLVPSAFFFFYIFSHLELKKRSVYVFLRKTSILIYFMHIWVQIAIHRFLPSAVGTAVEYIFDIMICVLVSFIIIRLSEKEKFKLLKKLYS